MPNHKKNAHKRRGFTLIEIVLAMTVLALLGSLVLPVYQGYVAKGRIESATRDIHRIASVLDRHYREGHPPVTLADVGLDFSDPWGNPYRYLWLRGNPSISVSGSCRRDESMNPINSDYDLYSMGPDGATTLQLGTVEARDDIIRARNGDFVGFATER